MQPPVALEELLRLRREWRESGQIVVCTNGIFDLLHFGHLDYLTAARSLGDVLVVGLNSDSSTRRYKGPLRPLVPEHERAALLLALAPVDYVTIFDELTAERLVEALQPDIYCKGGDYGSAGSLAKPLPEAAIVERYGGRVELIPYLPGHSTTDLIRRIVERYGSPKSA
ncbi:MAG TPA: adenylyltransferase/cytidyltransferase family protein [Herpetosiphonaceae bacterium]|jgi:rfaE bifunctional protein nucleotidyltransferase chain/domain|nr:adenylyltransferase/cytidyltransferase family protein [Herpetosiphonaceae bacterium]